MKNLLIAVSIILASGVASASTFAVCSCARATETDTTGYVFLKLTYADERGVVRDLMMGGYPDVESCRTQAERLSKLGRCKVQK